jgi:hypothetical protein
LPHAAPPPRARSVVTAIRTATGASKGIEAWRTTSTRYRSTARSKMIHGLIDSLDLEVRSWGRTDDDANPPETVEIIIAVGAAGVFRAMVAAFQIWTRRDKIDRVDITTPGGTKFSVVGGSAQDIETIVGSVEFGDTSQAK